MRLPATFKRCPACGQFTTSVAHAIERVRRRRANPGKKDPGPTRLRDGLLYVPAAIGIVASLVGAIAAAASLVPAGTDDMPGGLMVMLVLLAFLAVFAAMMIIGACAWGVWALLVLLVTWGMPHDTRTWLLDVAPLAVPRRTRKGEAAVLVPDEPGRAPWTAFRTWFMARRKRAGLTTVVALLCVEAAATMLAPAALFRVSWGSLLESVTEAMIGQAIAFAMILVPVGASVRAADFVFTRLEALRHASPELKILESVDVLRRGETWSGTALAVDDARVVAPISGKQCLGFRIAGRAGRLRIDDADVASLAVETEDGVLPVRATATVLALPEPPPRRVLDADARQRVAAFLASRGLPDDLDDVALGEERLGDGDAVELHGAVSTRRAEGSGYRDAAMERVIDDSDGLPVLIEPA